MSFRGITLEPIHKNIQRRLFELEEMHSSKYAQPGDLSSKIINVSATKIDGKHNIHKLNMKTVWFSLRSNAGVLPEDNPEAYVSPEFAHLKSFQSGDYRSRSARGKRTGADGIEVDKGLSPPPGIESIGISTKGAMGSLKTADVKIRVYHPSDIAAIEQCYLMPGITCFLEWGWSGTTPIGEDLYKGFRGPGGSKQLEERIIKKKLGLPMEGSLMESAVSYQSDTEILDLLPGQYDAMLGVITKFNWSLDSDGSYSINMSMISPNSLVMGIGLETHLLGATKNTGFRLSKGKYITKSKSIKIDGSYVSVPISTRTSISDAEFLCRSMVKLLMNDGKTIERTEVETSAAVAEASKGLQGKINAAKARIKKREERYDELIEAWEKSSAQREKYAKLSDPQGYGDTSAQYPLQAGFWSGWGTPIFSQTGIQTGPWVDSDKGVWGGPGTKADFHSLDAMGGSTKYMFVGKIYAYYKEESSAKMDAYSDHEDKMEWMDEEDNAKIKVWEQQQKDLGVEVEADKEAKTKGDGKAYTIKGTGDSKYIYFADDPTLIFKTMIDNMVYFEIKGKTLWKTRTTYGWHQDPTKTYSRNGIPVKYWWQEGTSKLDTGALLALRGWKRQSSGNEYEKANYVTWRWIEDYLLQQTAPKNKAGDPIISLNSTHVGADGSDESLELYYPNQCVNHPLIQSMDYGVCVLLDKQSKDAVLAMKNMLPEEAGAIIEEGVTNLNKKIGDRFCPPLTGYSTFGNASSGNIRDILVNIDHVMKTLTAQRTFESFVTTLLSDINDACGKPWDFSLQANEGDSHVLQVIDKNCTPLSKPAETLEINPIEAGKHDVIEPGPQKTIDYNEEAPDNITVFRPSRHYPFKGRGFGNILRSVSLNSKLPKSVQSMAFIANKSQTKNTQTKDTADFNIYGSKVVDLFYKDGVAHHQKSIAQKQIEFETKKASIYRDWGYTYNKLFKEDQTPLANSLSARQIQKQLVSAVVYGSPEQAPKPTPMPRLLPLELKFKLDGISGIYQGNSCRFLTVSEGGILPDRYKNEVLFQITKVQHSISDAGWETNVETMMRMIPQEDKEKLAGGEVDDEQS